ncbi:hypothetical protein VUR80DRAFT_9355 [Thermomyces stellatus]
MAGRDLAHPDKPPPTPNEGTDLTTPAHLVGAGRMANCSRRTMTSTQTAAREGLQKGCSPGTGRKARIRPGEGEPCWPTPMTPDEAGLCGLGRSDGPISAVIFWDGLAMDMRSESESWPKGPLSVRPPKARFGGICVEWRTLVARSPEVPGISVSGKGPCRGWIELLSCREGAVPPSNAASPVNF